MNGIVKKIYDYSLEEIMGERFGRYSKTIIQDRALPDVRDGLKPVQRRILYSMYKDRYTHDKPYQKSAKTVGNVMGNYHPHGDSSIYEAMVRMSQWWKQSVTYIDMHGNNGSLDGDSAAAMRYTEARLAKISGELLKDIDKNTIVWSPNYDDTLKEPTVLPAKFPNLLVNGSTGISAGYATNIPPHNLGEIIDATIKRIDSPNCHLNTILEIVKGPDFPTGAIIFGAKGIEEAYRTGRGRIILQAKYEIQTVKGKKQIIINELPYDVNKSNLVKKIDEIRIDKKIEGILEVRDESDLEDPMRIVIDLKKESNEELIINYLLKNTDLQISYNFNMVAIVNKRPVTLGILEILDAYLSHQKEIIIRRTEFDLEFARKRMHIVEGLIKALSILDDIIKTIRDSQNKSDAKINLQDKYFFTEAQAEAIVVLQLYKLTNTDITELKEEYKQLELIIQGLENILNNENVLKSVMKEELRKIKKEYAIDRKSTVEEEFREIKIDTIAMIPKEDVIVVVTNDGYVKRVSKRSYTASSKENTLLKEGDYVTKLSYATTLDTLLLFTNLGNYLYVRVNEIPDLKWGELGKHISNIIKINENEKIIESIIVDDFNKEAVITFFTKSGMVKCTNLVNFKVTRSSRPINCINLKKDDFVVEVAINMGIDVLIITKRGLALKFKTSEIPITGIKSSGVKAISLKDDEVVSAKIFKNCNHLLVVTDKSTAKRIRISDIKELSRARKGTRIIREVITNPYYIKKVFLVLPKDILSLKIKNDFHEFKVSEILINDLLSTGTSLTKKIIDNCFIISNIIEDNETEVKSEEISLEKLDERLSGIDSLLDSF